MKDLYKIAYECRNADSVRFWQMFTVMTVINGALLAFVGTHHTDKPFLLVPLGLFGASICFLWRQMQTRYAWWCEHWDQKLREFEPLVKGEINATRAAASESQLPPNLALFHEAKRPNPPGFSTRRGPTLMATMFATAWLGLPLLSVGELSSPKLLAYATKKPWALAAIASALPGAWLSFRRSFIRDFKEQMVGNSEGVGLNAVSTTYQLLARIFIGDKQRQWQILDPASDVARSQAKAVKGDAVRIFVWFVLTFAFSLFALLFQ